MKWPALLLLLLLIVTGCDWLWPLEGEFDPHRCSPACSPNATCRNGSCVSHHADSGPQPDGAPPKVDTTLPDTTQPEDMVLSEPSPAPDKDTTPACVHGSFVCLDSQNIKLCENGTWKNSSCTKLCVAKGYDYSTACKEVGGKATCQCSKWITYGGPCPSPSLCAPGLQCQKMVVSTGFCTKSCQKDSDCLGGPSGTLAKCDLNASSQKYCAFKCGSSGPQCPPGLTCFPLLFYCLP